MLILHASEQTKVLVFSEGVTDSSVSQTTYLKKKKFLPFKGQIKHLVAAVRHFTDVQEKPQVQQLSGQEAVWLQAAPAAPLSTKCHGKGGWKEIQQDPKHTHYHDMDFNTLWNSS